MAKNKLNFPAVLMHTIDGVQYRVDTAQAVVDEDAVNLTLVKLEDFYDVASET